MVGVCALLSCVFVLLRLCWLDLILFCVDLIAFSDGSYCSFVFMVSL